MDKKRILELRGMATRLESSTHVGKNGVTASLVEEVKRQLKGNKLVKIKVLKSALEAAPRDEIARLLAEKTGSELVDVRGNTVVLFRR